VRFSRSAILAVGRKYHNDSEIIRNSILQFRVAVLLDCRLHSWSTQAPLAPYSIPTPMTLILASTTRASILYFQTVHIALNLLRICRWLPSTISTGVNSVDDASHSHSCAMFVRLRHTSRSVRVGSHSPSCACQHQLDLTWLIECRRRCCRQIRQRIHQSINFLKRYR
jgi:hypothetical protein